MERQEDRPGGRKSEGYKAHAEARQTDEVMLLSSEHAAFTYLKSVGQSTNGLDSASTLHLTAASLLNDGREMTLEFPFCNETLKVSVQDFFKLYFQVVVKKGRFPEENSFFEAALAHCIGKLSYNSSSQRTHYVMSQDAKIPLHIIEESIKNASDPYIIRCKNEFAKNNLPKHLWGNALRTKIHPDEQREDKIPDVGIVGPMMHLFEQIGRKFDADIWMSIQMFLLLLDPAYADEEVSFEFRGVQLKENIRRLLYRVFNYDIGVTYYSSEINPQEVMRLAGAFMSSHMHILIDALHAVKVDQDLPYDLVYNINRRYTDFRKAILRGQEMPKGSLTEDIDAEWHLSPLVFKGISERLSEVDSSVSDISLWGILQLLLSSEKKKD